MQAILRRGVKQQRQFSCWDLQMVMLVVPYNLVWGWQEGNKLSKEQGSHSTLGSVEQTAVAVKRQRFLFGS